MLMLMYFQEGYLADHAVGAGDRSDAPETGRRAESPPGDPMLGLEGLDVAGPRPE